MSQLDIRPTTRFSSEFPEVSPVVKAAHEHREALDQFIRDYGKMDPDFTDPDTGLQQDRLVKTLYGPNSGTVLAIRSNTVHHQYYAAEMNVLDHNPKAVRREVIEAVRRFSTLEPVLTLLLGPVHEEGPSEYLGIRERNYQMVGGLPIAHLFNKGLPDSEGLHAIDRLLPQVDQYAQALGRLTLS